MKSGPSMRHEQKENILLESNISKHSIQGQQQEKSYVQEVSRDGVLQDYFIKPQVEQVCFHEKFRLFLLKLLYVL